MLCEKFLINWNVYCKHLPWYQNSIFIDIVRYIRYFTSLSHPLVICDRGVGGGGGVGGRQDSCCSGLNNWNSKGCQSWKLYAQENVDIWKAEHILESPGQQKISRKWFFMNIKRFQKFKVQIFKNGSMFDENFRRTKLECSTFWLK